MDSSTFDIVHDNEERTVEHGQSSSRGRVSESNSRRPIRTSQVVTKRGPAELRSIIGTRLQELDEFLAKELNKLLGSMNSLQEENSSLREELHANSRATNTFDFPPSHSRLLIEEGGATDYVSEATYGVVSDVTEEDSAQVDRFGATSSQRWSATDGDDPEGVDEAECENLNETYHAQPVHSGREPLKPRFPEISERRGPGHDLLKEDCDLTGGDIETSHPETSHLKPPVSPRIAPLLAGEDEREKRSSATMFNSEEESELVRRSPKPSVAMTTSERPSVANKSSLRSEVSRKSSMESMNSEKSRVTFAAIDSGTTAPVQEESKRSYGSGLSRSSWGSGKTRLTILSRLQRSGRNSKDSDRSSRPPQQRRRAQKLDSASKTFTQLPTWNLNSWEGSGSSAPLPRLSQTDKNFSRVVKMLSEKERHQSGRGTYRNRCTNMDRIVMSPMSSKSIALDFVAAGLILYDCVAIPLLLLEGSDTSQEPILEAMVWISRIFWTLSIPRAFITGYLCADGAIETNAPAVAKEYLHTWFLLDLAIVIVDWVESQSGGIARVIRVLKATRLVRMVRVPNMIIRMMNHASSERMLLYLSITKSTISFILLNHFLACIWYWVGNINESAGWVAKRQLQNSSIQKKYTYAIHWAASQFIGSTQVWPETEVERSFGAVVMIFSFIWSASFISGITAAMTRLQILAGQKGMLFASLRKFIANHRISEQLAIRVLASAKFALSEKERNQSEADVELLKTLSEPLLIEVHYETYSGVLTQHPFFWRYNHFEPLAVQKLCHSAIKILTLGVGDILFAQGEEPTDPRMYFVLRGTLLYYKDADADGKISLHEMVELQNPMWACEPVLWMKWSHVGTLRAAQHCSVLALSAERFRSTISEYRKTNYPALYATHMVNMMNLAYETEDVDDLCEVIDIKEVVRQVFPHYLQSMKSYFTSSSASSTGRSLSSLNLVLKRRDRPSGGEGTGEGSVDLKSLDIGSATVGLRSSCKRNSVTEI